MPSQGYSQLEDVDEIVSLSDKDDGMEPPVVREGRVARSLKRRSLTKRKSRSLSPEKGRPSLGRPTMIERRKSASLSPDRRHSYKEDREKTIQERRQERQKEKRTKSPRPSIKKDASFKKDKSNHGEDANCKKPSTNNRQERPGIKKEGSKKEVTFEATEEPIQDDNKHKKPSPSSTTSNRQGRVARTPTKQIPEHTNSRSLSPMQRPSITMIPRRQSSSLSPDRKSDSNHSKNEKRVSHHPATKTTTKRIVTRTKSRSLSPDPKPRRHVPERTRSRSSSPVHRRRKHRVETTHSFSTTQEKTRVPTTSSFSTSRRLELATAGSPSKEVDRSRCTKRAIERRRSRSDSPQRHDNVATQIRNQAQRSSSQNRRISTLPRKSERHSHNNHNSHNHKAPPSSRTKAKDRFVSGSEHQEQQQQQPHRRRSSNSPRGTTATTSRTEEMAFQRSQTVDVVSKRPILAAGGHRSDSARRLQRGSDHSTSPGPSSPTRGPAERLGSSVSPKEPTNPKSQTIIDNKNNNNKRTEGKRRSRSGSLIRRMAADTTSSVPYLQIDLTATPPEGGDLEVIQQIDGKTRSSIQGGSKALRRPSKEQPGTTRRSYNQEESKPKSRSRSLVKRLGATEGVESSHPHRRQRHSFHSSFNSSSYDDNNNNEESVVSRTRRRSQQDGFLKSFTHLEYTAGECVAPRRKHQQRQQHNTHALQALVLANQNRNEESDKESETKTALEVNEELGTKKRSKASKAKSALIKLTNKVKDKMFGGDNKADDKVVPEDCETTKESESSEHVEDSPSVSTEVRTTA